VVVKIRRGALDPSQLRDVEAVENLIALPHFSFGRNENGEFVERPQEQALEELWELTEKGGRDLVGVLDPPCRTSLWGAGCG
jgi:hypothetical protein